MRALTADEVLRVWERGSVQVPAERAITMLSAVCGDTTDALARLPIGRRDARLLALRERTLGPMLSTISECPHCGQALELELRVEDLQAADAGSVVDEPIVIRLGGREVCFRLPNTLDLLAAATAAAGDADSARRLLVERCALSARDHDGTDVPVSDLGDQLVASAASRMSEADPQADVQLALTCPDCRHDWLAPFDIAAFFWSELQATARRLLREAHELASNYGWSEASILAMSPLRRDAYLELVRS